MQVGSLSWHRQLKKFAKEYGPFLGNSKLAIVISIFEVFSWSSHSGLGVNSGISMSQNAGTDNLNNSGNDVANVGCSSSSIGGKGCVDASKSSMRHSRRSSCRSGASRRKKYQVEEVKKSRRYRRKSMCSGERGVVVPVRWPICVFFPVLHQHLQHIPNY